MLRNLLFFFLIGLTLPAQAKETVHLAIATSIQGPLSKICDKFSQVTDFGCKITSAPAGHLYAHIMHGMHYDVFLSSSETYIQGLINANKADSETRFVLASGRIVLWSADPNATAESLQKALMYEKDANIVIANPGVSSYGKAAKEVLVGYNLWNRVQGRLIYGKSLQHTLDLVASQRAPLGFVPLAKLSPYTRMNNQYWEPDIKLYKPVIYEGIVLKTAPHLEAALAFMDFLQGQMVCDLLMADGFNCCVRTKDSVKK